jgi:hypothetical protein
MKPPVDVPPSELYLKLCEPEPSVVIDFPRYIDGSPVGQLRVRVLEQREIDKARLDGEAAFTSRGVTGEALRNPATNEVLHDTIAREVLALACMTAESPKGNNGSPMVDEHGHTIYGRVFRDAKDLLRLRPNEIALLFAAHMLVQDKFGPYEKSLDPGDLDAWVERLVEGGSEFPLLRLRSLEHQQLTLSLAETVHTLYETLASLRSHLPPTLVSRLDAYFSAIGSSGEPPASSAATGGDGSEGLDPGTLEKLAADLNDPQ